MGATAGLKPTTNAEDIANGSRNIGPRADEFEVSLFGPGYGECIVLHIGGGQWIVVDSCKSDDGVKPAALEYLEKLNLDPGTAVSHVIISHADNDHIGGAAALFKACKSADLVYSAAFANRDMAAWIAAYSQVDPNELARASTEIAEILEELHKRDKVPTSAIIDRAIIDNGHCTVTALSPNDRRIESFRQSIVGQLPTVGQPRRRAAVLTPNQACVALLVESKAMAGILGADLEETPGRAWTRVIGNSIAYKQAKPAILIKVPHHGSINAHCEEIWNRMEQPPIALLATFNKGEKLPSKADVARIEGKTPHAYACSAYNRVTALKSHDSDKVLKMMQVKRTRRFASMGHIRVRFSDNGEPTVNLYGGAVPLAKVY